METEMRSNTNRRNSLALVAASLLFVGACGSDSSSSNDEITIVVTTTILGDIVENIVGSEASVKVLMPTGADPHDFQASARQTSSIHEADLVVANGLGLEEGLQPVLSAAENDGAKVLYVGPSVDPQPFKSSPDSVDPHVWLDPLRMIDAVDLVVDELERLEPSVDWSESADNYKDELTILDWELQALLGTTPVEMRGLVTNHDSLGYFADRYGFQIVGVVIPGGSTFSDISSDDLATLVGVVEDQKIEAIFSETTHRAVLARAVSGEVDWEVEIVELYVGSLGSPGTDAGTYLGLMRINAERVVSALAS